MKIHESLQRMFGPIELEMPSHRRSAYINLGPKTHLKPMQHIGLGRRYFIVSPTTIESVIYALCKVEGLLQPEESTIKRDWAKHRDRSHQKSAYFGVVALHLYFKYGEKWCWMMFAAEDCTLHQSEIAPTLEVLRKARDEMKNAPQWPGWDPVVIAPAPTPPLKAGPPYYPEV